MMSLLGYLSPEKLIISLGQLLRWLFGDVRLWLELFITMRLSSDDEVV
jgi:hypothetical protein